MTLYGGFEGTETSLSERDIANNETILSGDLTQNDRSNSSANPENVYHVVTGGTDSSAVLDGFTVTAGNAHQAVGGDVANIRGGGIYNDASSHTIANCSIQGNIANIEGGGIYNFFSSPSIKLHSHREQCGVTWRCHF